MEKEQAIMVILIKDKKSFFLNFFSTAKREPFKKDNITLLLQLLKPQKKEI